MEYSNLEWKNLAKEMNLTDETLQNIIIEVEQDKPGLEWLERCGAPLNPTPRSLDLGPTIFVSVVEKYAKVKVQRMVVESAIKFKVDVART